MRIAVLAWGSLVWNPDGLAITTEFQPRGPRLPVEFNRISRDGRLTLAIDERVGATCTTYSALCAFDDLVRALENLWIRQGTRGESLPKNIREHGRVGFIEVTGQKKQSAKATARHPNAVAEIANWARANGYDAAIWTALASNFRDQIGEPFSIEAAIQYLETREQCTFQKALDYIRSACFITLSRSSAEA